MWGAPFSRPVDSYCCTAQRAAHQGSYKLFTFNMEYCMFSVRFHIFVVVVRFFLLHLWTKILLHFINRDIIPECIKQKKRRRKTLHDMIMEQDIFISFKIIYWLITSINGDNLWDFHAKMYKMLIMPLLFVCVMFDDNNYV